MPIKRLYVAVYRQDYLVNWWQTEDRRNVQLSAVGSTNNTSSYAFELHLNIEPAKLEEGCLKGLSHYLNGRLDACPYLEGQNTLVEKHPQTVEGSATLF